MEPELPENQGTATHYSEPPARLTTIQPMGLECAFGEWCPPSQSSVAPDRLKRSHLHYHEPPAQIRFTSEYALTHELSIRPDCVGECSSVFSGRAI